MQAFAFDSAPRPNRRRPVATEITNVQHFRNFAAARNVPVEETSFGRLQIMLSEGLVSGHMVLTVGRGHGLDILMWTVGMAGLVVPLPVEPSHYRRTQFAGGPDTPWEISPGCVLETQPRMFDAAFFERVEDLLTNVLPAAAPLLDNMSISSADGPVSAYGITRQNVVAAALRQNDICHLGPPDEFVALCLANETTAIVDLLAMPCPPCVDIGFASRDIRPGISEDGRISPATWAELFVAAQEFVWAEDFPYCPESIVIEGTKVVIDWAT